MTRALVIALAGIASADTGGRMGGGNWGGGGSSPSSGGSYSSGGGGYTGGFSASDTQSSSPDTSFAWNHDDSLSSSSSSSGEPFDPYLFGIFVVCAIAMFWWWNREDRDFDRPSPAVNEPLRDLDATKAAFDRLVDDARSRFREETISNEQGVTTKAAPSQYTPRSEEGPGLVLVSMIIAARSELFTINQIASRADLCDHCGGPYPAECVSCPHCGAPAWKEAA